MRALRVLSLSTLFPSPQRPGFGKFVEYSLGEVAKRDDVELTIINPIGIPPWPLSLREPYRTYASNPHSDVLGRATVHYARFRLIPRFGADGNAARIAKAVLPIVRELHNQSPFDLLDAQFFFPDGPAIAHIAKKLDLPYSIKARGADIHFWGARTRPREKMLAAAADASGLLAVSEALKQDMIELGMPGDRISVHRTGIDRRRFQPLPREQARALVSAIPKLGVWAKGPLIVTTGALIERKGQRLAIEALAQLPKAHLVLAGTGPDEAVLRQLANRLDLADRVQFLGQVPHDLLPQLLSAADVMVLPSASEGIANAWIEALACGTPIVIPDVGGAREVLRDPSWGRITARTAEAITAAVSEILANPPSQNTVATAAGAYSWERNAAELVEHWRRIARR